MTKLEYLIFLKSNKEFLFLEESRLDEVIREDREDLIRNGYVYIEGNPGEEYIYLTKAGKSFLDSVE